MIAIRTPLLTAIIALASGCRASSAPAASPSTANDGPATAQSTASSKAWFGAACQVHDTSEATPTVTPDTQVFIELAEVRFDLDAPAPEPTPNSWVDDERFRVGLSMHVLATNDRAATTSLTNPALGANCESLACRAVTVTPHLDSDEPNAVRLDVAVTPPFPREAHIRTAQDPISATVQDQQVVMLGLRRGVVLAVTPYIIHHSDELSRLFACKQRAATRGSNPQKTDEGRQ